MTKDWRTTLIKPDRSLREAIGVIDKSGLQIALVTSDDSQLLGTVTDGDVRRGLLAGIGLEDPVSNVMNSTPTVANLNQTPQDILSVMKTKQLRQIPVVDTDQCVVGMEVIDSLLQCPRRDNPVILLAGGLGSRLMPLTENCPKPLLKVGDKPILERIIENFKAFGFHRFYLSVNYMAEMIEEYFGDGSQWEVEIDYLRERKRLGTAGAISLLPDKPELPFVVMNGDLLTKINFSHLLDFHDNHAPMGTMCVREYQFQVPFGVVKLDRHRLRGIDEKPVQRFFVNAGIYVLEPDVLNYVPNEDYLDMPTLFEDLLKNQHETAVFPIREYWLDIGRKDDFERANADIAEAEVFQ